MIFALNSHLETLYESLISKYKILYATVKKTQWAVTRTVPTGPFRSIPGVFERQLTVPGTKLSQRLKLKKKIQKRFLFVFVPIQVP